MNNNDLYHTINAILQNPGVAETLEKKVLRWHAEQLKQIASNHYDNMHCTYDYDGIAEEVLEIIGENK